MTGLTFTITPPHTGTPAPFTITPSHYMITSPFMDHQRLEFEQFKTSPRIPKKSRVVVTGQDATMPNFLGWVVLYSQPDPAKNKPQRYVCYGDSKNLEWRYPWLKDYTTGTALDTIFGDTPASQGLLFHASSLIYDDWELFDGGLSIWWWPLGGSVNSSGYPNVRLSTSIYLGTTLCTKQPDPPSVWDLEVNQWCQADSEGLFIRTAGAAPYTYPCCAVDFKNTYIKKNALTEGGTLAGPIYKSQESAYSLLKRIMRSMDKEFEFVNNADGYQYLNWGGQLARGSVLWWGDPGAFVFQEANYPGSFPKMYDWEWALLDPETYGFDMLSLQGKENTLTWAGDESLTHKCLWKDRIERDPSMNTAQTLNESILIANQYMCEDVFNMWAPENHTILPGDWVWFFLQTSPWNRGGGIGYLGRVIQKELEDDVMKLSIGRFVNGLAI